MTAERCHILPQVKTEKMKSLSCNCRHKNDFPMKGKCRTSNEVCKCFASVPTKKIKVTYVCLKINRKSVTVAILNRFETNTINLKQLCSIMCG